MQYSGGGVLKGARIVSQIGFILGIVVTAVATLILLFYMLVIVGAIGSLSALPYI